MLSPLRTNLFVAVSLLALGCARDSPEKRFQLGERLWQEEQYAAAVTEFETVSNRDPKGPLGLQALYRAAMIDTLHLSKHKEAFKRLKLFSERVKSDQDKWQAYKEMGEVLFTRMENYPESILHYRNLLKLKPTATDEGDFRYRIGKSLFYQGRFSEAISEYQDLQKKFPDQPVGEKALLEIATTIYTQGGDNKKIYSQALLAYQDFLKRYPKSHWAPEAEFGIANCFEELGQADEAIELYRKLQGTYPQPKVIEIKLARLTERRAQKNQER